MVCLRVLCQAFLLQFVRFRVLALMLAVGAHRWDLVSDPVSERLRCPCCRFGPGLASFFNTMRLFLLHVANISSWLLWGALLVSIANALASCWRSCLVQKVAFRCDYAVPFCEVDRQLVMQCSGGFICLFELQSRCFSACVF